MAYREENKQLVEKYISFLIAQPKELAVFYKIAPTFYIGGYILYPKRWAILKMGQ